DLVEARSDLVPPHAEHRPLEKDVVPSGEVAVESRPDLDQARHASSQHGLALGRLRDTGEDLEERRLACAVPADHAEDLSALELERDVPQRPEDVGRTLVPE